MLQALAVQAKITVVAVQIGLQIQPGHVYVALIIRHLLGCAFHKLDRVEILDYFQQPMRQDWQA